MKTKTYPTAIDSERMVIAAPLMREDALSEILAELGPDDFADRRNRTLFEAFRVIHEAGAPLDLPAIVGELERSGNLAAAGGKAYLADLIDAVSTTAGLPYHVGEVQAATQRRAFLELADRIKRGVDEGDDPEAINTMIRDAGLKIVSARRSAVVPVRDAVAQAVKEIEASTKGDDGGAIQTGLIDLDRKLGGGLRPGELIIIAARPGMGKSVWAANIAERCTKPVLVFSLEMTSSEIGKRMLASMGRVDYGKIREGNLLDGDWERLIQAANRLSGRRIFFEQRASLTVEDVCDVSERYVLREGVGLIVVDYLQLMRTRKRGESREREVAEISRRLKVLALDLRVPVVCLSQLNRESERRGGKGEDKLPWPLLSDLRESGAIEQDADVVVFIFRPGMYSNKYAESDARLVIAKGRNAKPGVVRVVFDGQHQRFENAAREE